MTRADLLESFQNVHNLIALLEDVGLLADLDRLQARALYRLEVGQVQPTTVPPPAWDADILVIPADARWG